MNVFQIVLDLFLHLDTHLSAIITQYGAWTYALLFTVIFVETGLVVTPFLPGDSLLFAGGTFAPLSWPLRREVEKRFHVSPFISMQATYRFRLSRPDAGLAIGIQEHQADRLMLVAAQTAAGQPLSDRNLLRALLAIPFLNLKVIAGIHWQALKIWLRGAPIFRKPLPPPEEISG